MPDIQTALRTALTKTLQTWDDEGEEGTPIPAPAPVQPVSTSFPATSNQKPVMTNLYNITNNVSRETFNYIKNNPGSTRMEIINALEHRGFGKGSVSSLIAQMRKSKMVHATDGLYYADVAEYQPIKNTGYKARKAKLEAAKKVLAKAEAKARAKAQTQEQANTAGIATLKISPEAVASPTAPKHFLTRLVRSQTPEEIIGNMTVYQARELYVHLKSMFGG